MTHVDSSACLQTVHKDINERCWRLFDASRRLPVCRVIVNTSFNFAKKDQPKWKEQKEWWREFVPD